MVYGQMSKSMPAGVAMRQAAHRDAGLSVLQEALVEHRVQHPNGHYIAVGANISSENSEALYRFLLQRRPTLVVEVGMAYGVSTLTILSALQANGVGHLISIDPYIGWPTGRIVALHQISRAGLSHLHEHRHACSHESLPKLLAEGQRPDVVYIDGNHNFDYAFTDFFFADKLLPVSGVVAFNDSGWRSVFKVIRFLKRYRKYRELDVGLPRVFYSRNVLFSLIKRLEGRSSHDRYFEKQQVWEPDHGFYRSF
jgi:predicted O-methyltransferase YrrM